MSHAFCRYSLIVACTMLYAPGMTGSAAEPPDTAKADAALAAYFRNETGKVEAASLAKLQSLPDWQAHQSEYRRQLREMLGLEPLPPRTDLNPVVTGRLDHPEFTVEKLHFQSRPGLYVTGNLYLPKERPGPVPAILYVCGHGNHVKNGVSYGSKTFYTHHGAWFARNGYACLVIDTLQLGEISGFHHGTYNLDRWWWMSRGYTPAGVEAWNCIRALDYLQSRPEIDDSKLGVTGRSGGGAYSWWISGIDERIQAAVPVAGITDLRNYVVDGAVEGHCDCMFMVNTYRWDYPQVAAMNFPRSLLVSNTDRDPIFPLDGVYRVYRGVRTLYDSAGKPNQVALNITAGGHHDTQELQVHAMRWFDQHLRGQASRPIENHAATLFTPEQLKVFEVLPTDELNTRIDEHFVAAAPKFEPPASDAAWKSAREQWLQALRDQTFTGWPDIESRPGTTALYSVEREGLHLTGYAIETQPGVTVRLDVVHQAGLKQPELVVLNPLDHDGWLTQVATLRGVFGEQTPAGFGPAGSVIDQNKQNAAELKGMLTRFPWAMAYLSPRGVGEDLWNPAPRKVVQNRRRFYLLGQTWEGMQVWDIRRAMQATRDMPLFTSTKLWLQGEGNMAALTLYASLFEPPVGRIDLHRLPTTHQGAGPTLLNVLKFLDIPQVLALAAERSPTVVYVESSPIGLEAAFTTAQSLHWPEKQLQWRKLPPKQE